MIQTKRNTFQMANDTSLQNVVYLWLIQNNNSGKPISTTLLCEKALD